MTISITGGSLTLEAYFENVSFQFYTKVQELDFFLSHALRNQEEFQTKPVPHEFSMFEAAQFYFSAYINTLVSTWEIARLSIELANEIEAASVQAIGEKTLSSNVAKFMSYFENATEEDFALFQFLKQARNANAHDGTLALNGGQEDRFWFHGTLERYETQNRPKSESRFTCVSVDPPHRDAIQAMLQLGIRLVPLFESKLQRPKQLKGLFAELRWPPKSTKAYVEQWSQHLD